MTPAVPGGLTVLIAPDSFKGSLTSVEVARALGGRLVAGPAGRRDPARAAGRRRRGHDRRHRGGRRLGVARRGRHRSDRPGDLGALAPVGGWRARDRRARRGVGPVTARIDRARSARGDDARHRRAARCRARCRRPRDHAGHRRQRDERRRRGDPARARGDRPGPGGGSGRAMRHRPDGPRPAAGGRAAADRLRRVQSAPRSARCGGHLRPAEGRDAGRRGRARPAPRPLRRRARGCGRPDRARDARGGRGRRHRVRAALPDRPIRVARSRARHRRGHGRGRLRRQARAGGPGDHRRGPDRCPDGVRQDGSRRRPPGGGSRGGLHRRRRRRRTRRDRGAPADRCRGRSGRRAAADRGGGDGRRARSRSSDAASGSRDWSTSAGWLPHHRRREPDPTSSRHLDRPAEAEAAAEGQAEAQAREARPVDQVGEVPRALPPGPARRHARRAPRPVRPAGLARGGSTRLPS